MTTKGIPAARAQREAQGAIDHIFESWDKPVSGMVVIIIAPTGESDLFTMGVHEDNLGELLHRVADAPTLQVSHLPEWSEQ